MLEICAWKWPISSKRVLTGLVQASRPRKIPTLPPRSKSRDNYPLKGRHFAELFLNSHRPGLAVRIVLYISGYSLNPTAWPMRLGALDLQAALMSLWTGFLDLWTTFLQEELLHCGERVPPLPPRLLV